jgi:hypothetical protein
VQTAEIPKGQPSYQIDREEKNNDTIANHRSLESSADSIDTRAPSLPTQVSSPDSDHEPGFQSLGIKTKKDSYQNLSDQSPITESSLSGIEAIKTYYPTEAEFQDPYRYIDSLHQGNARIGAVKIVPPASFDPEFNIDLKTFQFGAVKQSMKSSVTDNDGKAKFYKDLLQFHHDNNTPILRLPSIDKRVVDLFKLRNSVRTKGGFESVCKKKMWAQIGRELGYTGRIMTSLSSSLKVAYTKILLKFDQQSEDHESESQKEISEISNDHKKRPIEPNTDSVSIQKKQKLTTETPFIVNSKQLFVRERDILKSKGFKTNFESYSGERQGITHVDSSTYPFYDANFWHKGMEVSDYPYPSSELTRPYSFVQFYEIHSKDHKGLMNKNTDEFLIDEFWRILKEKDHFNVETATYLPTSIYGSGFPTVNSRDVSTSDITHPWNLNNLPLHEDGVLRYLNSENESITRPALTVSMLHSISSWGLEDQFLYSADYLHLGSNKLCYFIQPEDREKYENLIASKTEEYNSQSQNDTEFEEFSKEPIMFDIFEGLKQNERSTQRSSTTNSKFHKLYDHIIPQVPSNKSSDLFIEPSILQENGIRVHYTIQKPGEFIIKFPETFHSSVSLGGSISEKVNFAPLDWLNHAMKADEWFSQNLVIPAFSYFQLLVNIVEDSKDAKLLKIVEKDFSKFIELELQKRQDLRTNISHLRTINNKFDYICDDTLRNEFPTKLVITIENDDFIIDSVQFLNKLQNKQYDDEYFKGFSKFEMHVYYSDDKLRNLSKTLNTFSQTPEDWLVRYRELLGLEKDSEIYDKPSLKSLKLLASESERIQGETPEAQYLKKYIEKESVWVERAQEILSAKQLNRIRNRRQPSRGRSTSGQTIDDESGQQIQKDKTLLDELVKKIPELQFVAPEFDQILDLIEEISEYISSVKTFLKEDHTLEEFYDMVDLGKSYGVKLKVVDILERIVARQELLNRYEEIMNESKKGYKRLDTFSELLEEGYEVFSNEDSALIKNLEDQVKIGKYFTARIKHELENRSTLNIIKIDEMLNAVKDYPVDFETLMTLQDLKKDHLRANQNKEELLNRIKATTDEMDVYLKQRKLKLAGEPYDQSVYESAIQNYLGDSKDKRETYSEVKSIVDKCKELSPKVGVTGPLDYYLRIVEDWLRTCKKLFGKSNAPFTVLKGHLQLLLEKIEFSFNMDDVYVKNQPEEQHLIYCICRRPESGVMIACERCNEWYHCKCLKLGRGKTKDVENFICPICDYRVEFPREYNCPRVEDLRKMLDDSTTIELCPDELGLVRKIYQKATEFREYFHRELPRDENGELSKDIELEKLKFFLRKLEGSSVMLLNEYNELRQLVWSRDKCCDVPPPMIEKSTKTRKRKKTVEVKKDDELVTIANNGNSNGGDGAVEVGALPPLGNFQTQLAVASLAQDDNETEPETSPTATPTPEAEAEAEAEADAQPEAKPEPAPSKVETDADTSNEAPTVQGQ